MIKKSFNLALKDLRLEFYNKTVLISLVLITLMLVFLPSFLAATLRMDKKSIGLIVLWLVLIFNTITVLNKSLSMEAEEGAWEGIRLMPINPGIIFLGKFIFNFIMMTVNILIAFPLYMLFYNTQLPSPVLTLSVFLLSLTGFIGIGLLMALLSIRNEGRDTLLPVTVLPFVMPVLMLAMVVSMKTIQGQTLVLLWKQFLMIAVYNLIFSSLAISFFRWSFDENE